jgi:hypothetical protein
MQTEEKIKDKNNDKEEKQNMKTYKTDIKKKTKNI